MCLFLIGLSTMVVNASNHPKIEKQVSSVTEITPQDLQNCDIIVVTNQEDFATVLEAINKPFEFRGYNIFTDAILPEVITMNDRRPPAPPEWKPFGKVKTKHHSHWLFEPVKLC